MTKPKLEILITTAEGVDGPVIVLMDKVTGHQISLSETAYEQMVEAVDGGLESLEEPDPPQPARLH